MLAFSVEGNHLGPWQVDKMTKNDETHVNISVFSEAASASLYTRTLSILNAIPCLAALESYIGVKYLVSRRFWNMNQSYWRTSNTNVIVFFWPLSVRLRSNQCRAIQRLPTSLRAWTLRRMEADRSHKCSKHHRISLQFCVDTRRSPAALLLLWQLFFPIGAQATVRLLENEPNITVQAGHVSQIFHHFLPKASHNWHFHEVLWRGTELNLLRSREEPVERFLQRLGLSQSLSQIRGQTSYYMFKLLWRCRKLCIYMIIWLYDYTYIAYLCTIYTYTSI